MKRALELAERGLGHTAPNPMVGCVIVHNNEIVGEGWHRKFGGSHAEVNAINSVLDKSKLPDSILFVTLEPCSHHGKTPPCADLIVKSKIGKVVIATKDPNPIVSGNGIERLKQAGIDLELNVCKEEANYLNKRFNSHFIRKRPYVILKWAQSADGYMDKLRQDGEKGSFPISCEESHLLSHKWRTEEQAILIGYQTALNDLPRLTSRLWPGRNPLRIIIDPNLKIKADNPVLNVDSRTLVFNRLETRQIFNVERIQLDFNRPIVPMILEYLHYEGILSLLVEGGKNTLETFIDSHLVDEIRRFTSKSLILNEGLKAPVINSQPSQIKDVCGKDNLETFIV